MQRSNEPEAFLAFERAGWETGISDYERVLGALTAQSAEPTLDAARVAAGSRMLDVCTGHGVLAAAAIARGATVSGIDFAEEVLAAARRNVPTAEFRQGDAQDLPYPGDTFDAVACGYGIMHVPEPDRALAEMYRVLKSGGHIALSVWERPMPDNGFGLLFGAIRAHGRLDVPLPHGPDFFQFSDPESMRAALLETGFENVTAIRVSQVWRFEQSNGFIEGILKGTVRAKALLNAQEPTALAAINAAIEEGTVRLFHHGDRYDVAMPAFVGSGTKP